MMGQLFEHQPGDCEMYPLGLPALAPWQPSGIVSGERLRTVCFSSNPRSYACAQAAVSWKTPNTGPFFSSWFSTASCGLLCSRLCNGGNVRDTSRSAVLGVSVGYAAEDSQQDDRCTPRLQERSPGFVAVTSSWADRSD